MEQDIEEMQELNGPQEEKPEETKSFSRLKQGLSKTREGITAEWNKL